MAELDMNKKISVKNLSNIDTYFRCIERPFDAKIPRKNSALFSIGEILSQVNASNPDFVGTDGKGTHASLYITDKAVRIEAGFENEDGRIEQEVVDEKNIVNIFSEKDLYAFYDLLKTKIVTIGEKQTLKDVLDSGKVNEHDKVSIAEKYLRGEQIEIKQVRTEKPDKMEKTEEPDKTKNTAKLPKTLKSEDSEKIDEKPEKPDKMEKTEE